MRVALFCETYYPFINGVVTHVKILKDGLEKKGHEVLIVTADPHCRHHYVQDGVLYCPSLPIKRAYEYGLASPYSRKRFKFLKEFNPDIIHIHQEFGVGLFGLFAAKRLHVPLVYTLHTMYDDYMYYFFPPAMIPAAQKIMRTYSRFFARRAYSVTGPSKKVDNYLQRYKVNVIPNPVETDLFNRDKVTDEQKEKVIAKMGLHPENPIITFCGRLGHEKNIAGLLDMFQYALEQDNRYQLVIIGDGPVKEELFQYAEKLGIDKNVFFAGKVAHDDLPPYYAVSHLYITASKSDTNSISMLEAMSMGLPVLHIKDELNQGQVEHGINGFIYNNKEELYQYLNEYLNMSKEEQARIQQSTIDIANKRGADSLASNLLEIYSQCLKQEQNKQTKAI